VDQESLIGSTFSARYRWHARDKGEITPIITGTQHITGEARLRLDPADPYCWGRSPVTAADERWRAPQPPGPLIARGPTATATAGAP